MLARGFFFFSFISKEALSYIIFQSIRPSVEKKKLPFQFNIRGLLPARMFEGSLLPVETGWNTGMNAGGS